MSVFLIVVVILVVAAITYRIERKKLLKSEEYRSSLQVNYGKRVAEYEVKMKEYEAKYGQLMTLDWTELRALCNEAHQHDCECSTKQQIVDRLIGHMEPAPVTYPRTPD